MGRPKKVRGTCSVPRCGIEERTAGLCRRHYMNAWRKAHSAVHKADQNQWPPDAVAYVAGLLEARGHFGARRGRDDYWRFTVRITVLDREVASRVYKALGFGSISGPNRRPRSKYKEVWVWSTSRRQHISELCEALYPHLGPTRQKQVDGLMETIEEQRRP